MTPKGTEDDRNEIEREPRGLGRTDPLREVPLLAALPERHPEKLGQTTWDAQGARARKEPLWLHARETEGSLAPAAGPPPSCRARGDCGIHHRPLVLTLILVTVKGTTALRCGETS